MGYKDFSYGLNGDIGAAAAHYGLYYYERLASEECGELLQAISKLHRSADGEDVGDRQGLEANLVEEIADVENVLQAIKHLRKCSMQVYEVRKRKAKRQLERMKKEERK